MEEVKISRAKVIPLAKGKTDVLSEFKTEQGGVRFNFRVETRVNDRNDRSPRLFRRCSYFAKTGDEQGKIRNIIALDALLEVEGRTNVRSFDGRDGKVYLDEVDVMKVTAINPGTAQSNTADEDLPF